MRIRSRSASVSRPALSKIPADTPMTPTSCTKRRTTHEHDIVARQTDRGRRGRGQPRDASRVSERERRLDVGVVGEGLQRRHRARRR